LVSRTGLADAFGLDDPIVTSVDFSGCIIPTMALPESNLNRRPLIISWQNSTQTNLPRSRNKILWLVFERIPIMLRRNISWRPYTRAPEGNRELKHCSTVSKIYGKPEENQRDAATKD
jgi:hypothetical protein